MDRELVERLQKGDTEAFSRLFDKYANRIFEFGLKYLRSKQDAEGLVQDVFLKVWERRKSLDLNSSFESYLFTIAYHDICNIFRKRVNQRKFIDELLVTAKEEGTMNSESVDYKFVLDLVDQLILELPETQQKVFVKSKKEGLSSKQIAREFKISPGTVDNYVSATLRFLREKLGKETILLFPFLIIIFSEFLK